ncbi:MAG: DSD1 family PLP-dependent enzyme [Rhodospirillales bacterium]|nr:DSD1 family PLP-dependent enzyme [Rhodospirillales bacterium]MBO6787862.1 DSD1 family PLP-dependent enzyme [Rhodospirillales bacterium]
MTQPPPAEIGDDLQDVDTPALLIDLDAFEANIEQLAKTVAGFGVRLRAHSKTHKCPEIAKRQMAAGAVGICCQKVGEAEAMVAGGVPDVLVTNQIWGEKKLNRLAALARDARIGVLADDAQNVRDLALAARDAGVTLDVYVEIDVGAGRCGIDPGEPAAELAGLVVAEDGLNFAGLQAYHGSAQHIRTANERGAAIGAACDRVRETLAAMEKAGIDVPIVTGAGTGSFRFEAASGLYQEMQCGSYIFMDADYAQNMDQQGDPFTEFRHSLYVLVTVMSATKPGRAVVDAGHKALGNDQGMPWVADIPGARYEGPSDDHGTLVLDEAARGVLLGEKIRLIPGHCDPTVNLYDWFVVVQGGRVVDLWEISARGATR